MHELDQLDPKRARYLAAFCARVESGGRGRLAHQRCRDEPRWWTVFQQAGNLPVAQATLVVEIAKSQNRLFGGTENFLVTREFRDIASDDERPPTCSTAWVSRCLPPMMPSPVQRTLRSGKSPASFGFSHPEFIKIRAQLLPTSALSCAPRTTEATPLNHR